ncbi:glycosyltransferase [Bacillus sp. MRMR6]|uniref:glycosyltransferase n=1 Tax=Bacillus sp. MRMR6 TaxID=1928617 RepID=UPI0015889C1D|nr:glycosyltransferase [Bacillus sp. MRMR6]
MEKKKLLVLINDSFPFKPGETFLETEIKYYNKFDKVLIYPFPSGPDNETSFTFDANVEIIKNKKENHIFKKLFNGMAALLNREVIREIVYLNKINKLNLTTIKVLISFISNGNFYFKELLSNISNIPNKNEYDIYIYSYWMHIPSYIAILLKKNLMNSNKCFVITRNHRFDLYEDLHVYEYIPMRQYIINNMEKIYCISDDALSYLISKYPEHLDKFEVSRLGTRDFGLSKDFKRSHIFRIVSCSWVRPVKRVSKILDALIELNIPIEWTHIGDGELLEEIKQRAKKIEKSNIKCIFKGALENKDILNKYKDNQYDVFINVSESEGVPVSIMEAISFGIPVIGTDVGGTKEIVIDGLNGYLLPKNFSTSELARKIEFLFNMDTQSYIKMRNNSRELWEEKYNADMSYSKFIDKLISN